MSTELGDLVGYRVRFDHNLSSNTKLKFVTDGMLLREAILDPLLTNYLVIVLDEAHERTVNSDVLLAILKDIASKTHRVGKNGKKYPPLKLIVMSATLDLNKYQNYF